MTATACVSSTSSNVLDLETKNDPVWCGAPSPGYGPGHFETLEQLLACGTVAAALPPRCSTWSPEKRLAGAILASALVEIRDHHDDRAYCHSARESLEWVASDDCEWPFSFVRLCQLFDLDPSWVRAVVRRWTSGLGLPRNDVDVAARLAAMPSSLGRRTIHAALA